MEILISIITGFLLSTLVSLTRTKSDRMSINESPLFEFMMIWGLVSILSGLILFFVIGR